MRALAQYEADLRRYVDGVVSFETVEGMLRYEVRAYASRRAAKWSSCASFVDDIAQVLLTSLWRNLDAFDPESTDSVAPWCGARMEFELRRFLRAHRRVIERVVFDDDAIEDVAADCTDIGAIELVASLRNLNDDGVRAYVLATIDAGGDVVSRLASDDALLAWLGWSDVTRASNAARRRAQRCVVLRDAIGGM